MKHELSHLTSQELVRKTQDLAREERVATLALIEALRETDRRLIFADLGYGSLFEFATKHLGLSEGSAQRRIQAMRLTRDVPEVKAQIADGTLSLSNAAKVQSFCQQEKRHGRVTQKDGRKLEKREIVAQIQGLSQKACERKLFEISPQSMPRERERVVSPTERELRTVVSEELYQKIERIRGLLAHAKPEASLAELLEIMAEAAIEKLEKKKQGAWTVKVLKQFETEENDLVHTAAATAAALPAGVRIHLPKATQGAVWIRAGHQCEYTAPDGKRCTSQYRLEIDHRKPLALGGANEITNLRLLCRSHNTQQAALECRTGEIGT